MSRLYAVAQEQKSAKQEAREAVRRHREGRHVSAGGLLVGERTDHRGWPPEVTLAFMAAPVIKPAKGEIQKRLYPRLYPN